jgi:methyl-accepting chemotaxis protein
MIRARAAVLVLLAMPAGLACGDDDDTADRFRDGYNQAIERLNEVNSDIQESGEQLAAQPGAEIGRQFDRIAETAARTRAELAELEPPEQAREEFEELLAAVQDGIRDIRAAADAARTESQERFNDAAERLSESGQEIAEAEEELKDAVESD